MSKKIVIETPMDRAGDFVMECLEKYKKSRRYINITYHRFHNLELVVVNVNNKVESRLFRDGVDEIHGYWLAPEQRAPLVAKMIVAGMKQKLIAQMLKMSYGTINRDVRFLRAYTNLLDNVVFRRPLNMESTAKLDKGLLTMAKHRGRNDPFKNFGVSVH